MQGILHIHKTYRNPIKYGDIEGCQPKKLPSRGTGEVSLDLKTQDIIGAQAGTKGLGPFAEKARQTIKISVTTQDIEGAQAGTIKKGNAKAKMSRCSFQKND